jgi:2-keto-4-pentenoate hydratase/2-oxohepta-3-ene-1,7-dioic acid hydratase in catechol pathway
MELARTGRLALSVALAAACRSLPEAPAAAPAPLEPHTVEIASPAVALTFARVGPEASPRVVAVTSYTAGTVTGVDLSTLLGRPVTDPVRVFGELGYDRLRAALASATIDIPATELLAPLDLRDRHIAAGTNYPEHAGESGVKDGPFLFPKLVAPTGPRARVSAGDGLLDYEVELAWVALEPFAGERAPATMGLVLCNDYTDRATLLRHVDPWDPASGIGFTTGKSFPGYLPVGDLFVVPRDFRSFGADLELRLWVNGELRQRAHVREHVWDVDEIVAQARARRDTTWDHRGTRVALPGAEGTVPERTLIMAGTPAGTVFRGVGLGTRVAGAAAWLFGGWSQPIARQVIETYVRDAHASRRYLQPGDRVVIHVDRLGIIANDVVR